MEEIWPTSLYIVSPQSSVQRVLYVSGGERYLRETLNIKTFFEAEVYSSIRENVDATPSISKSNYNL